MDKGANKIKGAIFDCFGDCVVSNVLKIFLKYFIWKLEKFRFEPVFLEIFYYVNIYI
jgi:hypothetical protein